MITPELKTLIRRPFFSLHMDGRNEYGTHLLSLPGSSIDTYDEVMDQFKDPKDGCTESIFQEAEKLGFRTGDAIVTLWQWHNDEIPYLEYDSISPELTELFWGTPSEQRAATDCQGLKEEL